MEQRRLRLGDILDDYCPRERRLTNHAVVAMIEEDVKQTRCTTCDAEHAYKGGKVPRRRKKETTGALYKEVLAGMLGPTTARRSIASAIPTPRPTPVDAAPTPAPTASHGRRAAAARNRAHATGRLVQDVADGDRAATSGDVTSEPSLRRRRSRRGPGSPAADPRAAAEDRRAEGRAAAAGVHDPSAQRQRSFPRRRPRMKPQRPRPGRQRPRRRQRQSRRTAGRASPARGLPEPAAAAGRPRRPAAASVPVSRQAIAAAAEALAVTRVDLSTAIARRISPLLISWLNRAVTVEASVT